MKSIHTRIIVIFSVLIVLSGLLLSFVILRNSQKLLSISLGERVLSVAEQASGAVNPESFQKIVSEVKKAPDSDANKNSILKMPEYKMVHDRLHQLLVLAGFKYLYTMIELPDNKYMYIVDGTDINNEGFSMPGNIEKEEYPLIKVAFQTQKSQVGELTQNETWGATITAYAPILDSNGKMIGVIGADYDASGIYSLMQKNKRDIAIAVVGILLVSILISAFFARHITKPLKELVRHVEYISGGDLTVKFISQDKGEIGKLAAAFNSMTEKLQSLVRDVSRSVEQLAASAEEAAATTQQSAATADQISVSAIEVAGGAEKQLQTVKETLTIVENMSHNIQQITSKSESAADFSKKTVASANDGKNAIEKVVTQMSLIESSVNNSAQAIAKLGGRSQEIGQIIDAISGIASQTNLLALNAAIEAARAGEQGRGFAVVADEVRKLAEQSQEAAQRIAKLIGEILSETDNAVEAMNVGTAEVKAGANVVNTAGEEFVRIVALINQVFTQVSGISANIQHLVSGSETVVSSVTEIEETSKSAAVQIQNISSSTEEQSASMQEIAASGQMLTKLAEDLQTAIKVFKI